MISLTSVEIRALKRLSAAGMSAAPTPGRDDVYGVFPQGDRRRRPIARLPRDCVIRTWSVSTTPAKSTASHSW